MSNTTIDKLVTAVNLDEYVLPGFTATINGKEYRAKVDCYQDIIDLFEKEKQISNMKADSATKQLELLKVMYPDIPDEEWKKLDPRLGSSLLYQTSQYIWHSQNAAFGDLENFKSGKAEKVESP